MNLRRQSLPALGTALFVSLYAFAAPAPGMAAGLLQLSHTELRMEPGSAAAELYAENKGDTPLYLDIEQQLLLNPGHRPEQLVPVREVARPTLLVAPERLVLAPGQKYRMALKALATPASHQVWRLSFRPRQQVRVDAAGAQAASAPLVMSIGYGVLIYQLAPSPSIQQPIPSGT